MTALTAAAFNLISNRVLTSDEVSNCFLTMAAVARKQCHSPVMTAEWLRDAADGTERADLLLYGRVL